MATYRTPERLDATVHLGDGDLVEVIGAARASDATARFYDNVQLQGALLVGGLPGASSPARGGLEDDPTMLLDDEALREIEVREDRTIHLDDEALREVAIAASRPPSPVERTRRQASRPPTPSSILEDDGFPALTLGDRLGALFEPGRVAPLRLAACSYVAGLITALLGVALVM